MNPEDEPVTDLAVLDRAVQVLGSTSAAMRWMLAPNPELDGATPRSRLHSRSGKREVLLVLTRLKAKES
jgi:uncharacterized protein (DUF2384 family)